MKARKLITTYKMHNSDDTWLRSSEDDGKVVAWMSNNHLVITPFNFISTTDDITCPDREVACQVDYLGQNPIKGHMYLDCEQTLHVEYEVDGQTKKYIQTRRLRCKHSRAAPAPEIVIVDKCVDNISNPIIPPSIGKIDKYRYANSFIEQHILKHFPSEYYHGLRPATQEYVTYLSKLSHYELMKHVNCGGLWGNNTCGCLELSFENNRLLITRLYCRTIVGKIWDNLRCAIGQIFY